MNKKILTLLIVFLLCILCLQNISIASLYNTKIARENIKFYSNSNLPSEFSWRNINGVDFTTPVRNQKRLPSCETFAIVAAVETMVQYKVGYPFGCDLSEAHLYFFSGGNTDWGSFPENDTNFLKEYGVPDEACWKYPSDNFQYPLLSWQSGRRNS